MPFNRIGKTRGPKRLCNTFEGGAASITSATGGNIYTPGDGYKYHIYNGTDNFVVTGTSPASVAGFRPANEQGESYRQIGGVAGAVTQSSLFYQFVAGGGCLLYTSPSPRD